MSCQDKLRLARILTKDVYRDVARCIGYELDPAYEDEEYKDFIQYQALKNKLNFEPFTVDVCRENINKEIHTYFQNGGLGPDNILFGPTMIKNVSDRNKPNKVFKTIFVPNGDARIGNRVIKHWLLGEGKLFTNNDVQKGFYLLGQIKFDGDDNFHSSEVALINSAGWLATAGSGDSWIQSK